MRALRIALRSLVRLVLVTGWIFLALGLGLHLTLRDGLDPLAVLFHALPLPILAGLSGGLTLCGSQWFRSRLVSGILCLIISVTWLARSFHWSDDPLEGPGDLKVLVWNLARPDEPSEKLVELIREHQPDVASIVEPGKEAGDHMAWYQERLPGYEIAWMPRGILWFSKWPSRYRSRGKLDNLGAYAWFEVKHRTGPFRFVSIDVYPLPFRPRTGQLREALEWTAGEPHVIMGGDFNTPLESVHFEPYHDHLTNAFNAAGRGFRETWFWTLPLLSLDQIWCGPEWQPLSVKKIHTTASDHAALIASFTRTTPASVQPGDEIHKTQP